MIAYRHLFCRYDNIKIIVRQVFGPISHTLQEWQSSLMGIDNAVNINASQNKCCASRPKTEPVFAAIQADTKEITPNPHNPFQSKHLKCFLSIKMQVNKKIYAIDLL